MKKKAIVIPAWLSCILNRNLCQRVRNYLIANGYIMCSSIEDANLIIYAGCGVSHECELQSLAELSFIENKVIKAGDKQTIVLISCLHKINKKTRGGHYNSNSEYKETLIGTSYQSTPTSQFIFVDNYDYSTLDELIQAQTPFDSVPYPTKIEPSHGIEAINVSYSTMRKYPCEHGRKLQRVFLEELKIQNTIKTMGFFFPVACEHLQGYGYRQITIGMGCKNNCSYCAIKFAKNKLKSIECDIIVSQIKELLTIGENKFVLLCDDLGSWGLDLKSNWRNLIEKIEALDSPGMKLALFNLKVEDLLEEKVFINRLVNKGLISYIGVMGQHVNRRLLTLMKRVPFVEDDFVTLINNYGDKGVHIHTYNIIGFPSETEKEFQELVDFIGKIQTPNCSILNFRYSERKTTVASTYQNKIPRHTIAQRMLRINEAYLKTSQIRFSGLHKELYRELSQLLELYTEREELFRNFADHLVDCL